MNQAVYIRRKRIADIARWVCCAVLLVALVLFARGRVPLWVVRALGMQRLGPIVTRHEFMVVERGGVAAVAEPGSDEDLVAQLQLRGSRESYIYAPGQGVYSRLTLDLVPIAVYRPAMWDRIKDGVPELSIMFAGSPFSVRPRVIERGEVPTWRLVYAAAPWQGLGVCAAAAGLGLYLLWPRSWRVRRRKGRGECARCGYGLSAAGCSECGLAV